MKCEIEKKEMQKAEAGDLIEIRSTKCLLVQKANWEHSYFPKTNLAVVILTDNEDDWMRLGNGYQTEFEKGNYRLLAKSNQWKIVRD